MGKPTKQELDSAFQEAKRLIWQQLDKHALAKTLFALNDQYEELDKVFSACDAYINSGHSTTAHRRLISAINSYRNLFTRENADYTVNVTDEELDRAINEAGRLRESGNDNNYIAKTVLSLHYRVKQLEALNRLAERYLHSGLSNTELQNLEKAIKKYQSLDNQSAGRNISAFGIY